MTSSDITGTETDDAVDGRRAWRERNRDAVVDAMLDLYEEGVLNPGAQDVAERSGVSRRSLFRYFDDMDDLCRTAIERHSVRVGHLFEIERLGEGPLNERIDRLVDHRIALYEGIAYVRRVAKMRAPFQPILAAEMERSTKLFRRQVERHFERELDKLDASERDELLTALDIAVSFEAYDMLVQVHGMPPKRIAAAMRRSLAALLAPAL